MSGQAVVPGVRAAEVVAGFVAVAVGLEEDDVVTGGDEGVDEGAAVAAASVGGVGDAVAEEAPEAVADPHLVTHRPSSIRAVEAGVGQAVQGHLRVCRRSACP